MKKFILGICALAFLTSLYGCNTIKGVGDDLMAIGGWISGSSDHVRGSMSKDDWDDEE